MTKEVILTYAEEDDPLFKRIIISTIEYTFGRRKLQKIYRDAINSSKTGDLFWEIALEKLGISLKYDKSKLSRMPASGPLLIIANHPFGVLDGLMLCTLVSKVRKDFKVMLHKTLCREEFISDFTIPIDFQETKKATITNIESKKQVREHIENGGAAIIFPAGGVATANNIVGKAEDLTWKSFPARLIQEFKPTVMPFYFTGQNSIVFHAASKISVALRSSMYVREIIIKMGKEFDINIGEPISANALKEFKNRNKLTEELFRITKNLA